MLKEPKGTETNGGLNLIAISYAKGLLESGSRERGRARRYAAALASYQVIIFTKRREGFSGPIEDGSLTIYPTNSRSRVHMFYDAYRIGKKLLQENRNRQHIISSQDPFEAGAVGAALAYAKNATHHVQLHECVFCGSAWRTESVRNRIRYWFGRFLIRRARCIRVVSERIKHSLIALGVPAARITVLPIAVELEPYLHSERPKQESKAVTVLTAGRLVPVKNIELIINSVGVLHERHPALALRIVGSGPEEARLRALVHRRGLEQVVTFVPWAPSLVDEMHRADIFALASNHEGYGLVLVEAMAASLPVVSTDVGCAGELLRNGEHGVVVRVGDMEAFTAALETLLARPAQRRRFGEAGRMAAQDIAAQSGDTYVASWVRALSCCYNKTDGS